MMTSAATSEADSVSAAASASASAATATTSTDIEMASLKQRLESFLDGEEEISWKSHWQEPDCLIFRTDPQHQDQEDSHLCTV